MITRSPWPAKRELTIDSGEEEVFGPNQIDLEPGQTETVNLSLIFNLGFLPRVAAVKVASSDWHPDFLEEIDPGVGAGYTMRTGSTDQLNPLSWANIDQIIIEFSEDVKGGGGGDPDVADFDFASDLGGITLDSVDYDSVDFRATLNLSGPLGLDRFSVTAFDSINDGVLDLDGEFVNTVQTLPFSGDLAFGGDFVFDFAVSPGNASFLSDSDLLGQVNFLDLGGTAGALGTAPGDAGYLAQADLNGNAIIDFLDLGFLAGRLTQELPPAPFLASLDDLFADDEEDFGLTEDVDEFAILMSDEDKL